MVLAGGKPFRRSQWVNRSGSPRDGTHGNQSPAGLPCHGNLELCAQPEKLPSLGLWITTVSKDVPYTAWLIFGTLYPAYYSYKAVKSKDIKEYVKWMMYWIIFALFTTAETFTDIFLCWFPFYYELKIAFVAWLLSPYTKGSSLLYRKFVHPTLSSKEKEIDDCLVQAKDRSYDALVHFGKRGLNVAATAAVMAASKGQGALSERLRSFSMQDLSTIRGDGAPAPSSPPPPGPGRASGKHGQPKMSRSASESAGSSGPGKIVNGHSVVEGDVNEGGVKAWGPHQVQNPLAFSDEEEEDLLDFMYKFKAPRKTEFPLEVHEVAGKHFRHIGVA
ncbi:hypothetical protein E5288_WYG009756 [Bos mutus]|uniref:Receptor expression-enhancing protein n=2 Tax=Bos mutus TaxID=72004 RepID=A0A6B0R437_9CETA|nr:hypothetical protein [Bos mutus]